MAEWFDSSHKPDGGRPSGLESHGFTRAYRAIGEQERVDILETSRFRSGPNSLEGKWFFDTIEGAIAHGEFYYPNLPFWLVQAEIPDDAPSLYPLESLDGHGPARYIEIDDLERVVPHILERP